MITVEEYKAQIKQYLIDTDYVMLSDVALDNKDEFVSYRAFLRECYKKPDLCLVVGGPPNPIWTA
jgi:hypothetical protein